MSTDCHTLIVGGGVVGLATAAALSRLGRSVVLVERHGQLGRECSSRNSGVIHAGIYYPKDSLKARLCVRGRQLLYERCARLGIGHRRLGKLVVAATAGEQGRLEQLLQRGVENGAGALRLLSSGEVAQLEPAVHCAQALFSPETGIIDAHELMYSYAKETREGGGIVALGTRVVGLEYRAGTWTACLEDDSGVSSQVSAPFVVNAAGLDADAVLSLAGVDVEQMGWRLKWCKGDYFSLPSRWAQRIHHLVYPLPARAGLGVHLTLNLGGELLAGPDATYLPLPEGSELRRRRQDYQVSPAKAVAFASALQRYVPGVVAEDLTPAYAGIRPKLQGPGEGFRDFVIEECSARGAPQLFALLGIESPGLTAAEAIAERVVGLLQGVRSL